MLRVWLATAFAVAGVVLLSGTAVAEPALYTVIYPPATRATDSTTALSGFPLGPTDQRIFQVPDSPGEFFAAGASFAVVFHLPTNPPLVTFYTDDGEMRINTSSARPEVVTVRFDSNRITYRDYYGPGIDLSYLVALTGLKEEIIVHSPEALESLRSFPFELTLPDARPLANLADVPVLFQGMAHGPVRLSDGQGRAVASLPPAIAIPADLEERGEVPMSYLVQPYGDRLRVALVVGDELRALPPSAFPLVLDPSIDPVDTTVTYSFETIVQEGPLVVLPTGFLTLDHVTLLFNLSTFIQVDAGGRLDLANSYVGSVDDLYEYSGTIDGTLNAADTTFEHISQPGISLGPSGDAKVDRSTFLNSAAGLRIASASVSGHVQDSVFDHVATGLAFVGSFSLAGFTVSGNSFAYGDYGILVQGSNLSASQITSNDFDHLDAAGVLVNASGRVALSFNTFTRNNKGVAFEASGSSTLNSDSLTGNSFGIVALSSTATLTALYQSNVNFDLYSNNSSVTLIGGNTQSWVISQENTQLTVKHLISVQALNANGTPAKGVDVKLYDSAGNLESNGTADDAGWVRNLNATEYESHGGAFAFYTPHRLRAGSQADVHAVMDADRTFTVYNSTDADGDGRSDSDEDAWRDVQWVEAENRVLYAGPQTISDYNATGEKASGRQPTGYYFLDIMRQPPVRPGAYQLLVRARATDAPRTLQAVVGGQNGTTLVAANFALDTEYRYYETPLFNVTGYQKLRPQFDDLSQGPPGTVLVDRFALVRYFDDQGNRTAALPGKVSDPVTFDSDVDSAPDGLEVAPRLFWFEAERVNGSTRVVQNASASNSYAVAHENQSRIIIDDRLAQLGIPYNATVESWVRVRCAEAAFAPCTASIAIAQGDVSAAVNVTVGLNWTWVNSSRLTITNAALPVNVTVRDESDTNLTDGVDALLVDRFAIADVADYPTPLFYLGNALDADLDRDGLDDGHEIREFFTKDKIESESSADSVGFDPVAGWMRTGRATPPAWSARYFTLNFSVDRYAEWAVEAYGKFTLFIDLPSMTPPNLTQAFNYSVASASNPSEVFPVYHKYAAQMASGDDNLWGSMLYNNYSIVNIWSYLLGPGNFTLNVTLNITYLEWLNSTPPYSMGNWALWHDFVLIERRTLDPFDPDSEDDGVWDGVEFERAMYPLNPDTDYDNVSDGEEVYAGVDNRTTNPLSPDTDGDALRDWAEIFGQNPTDATSMDSDGDSLPDGWIDGYHYYPDDATYLTNEWFKDGKRQPWEGEDLDLDGAVEAGAFAYNAVTGESAGGETNPNAVDTDADSIDDGWEVRFKGCYIPSGAPAMLDPLNATNATTDIDQDGLTNVQEYNFETDPYRSDTDGDGIKDGDELRISLRTSIPRGALTTGNYNASASSDYVYFDENPYDGASGRVYWYSAKVTDAVLQTRLIDNGFEEGQAPTATNNTTLFPSSEVASAAAYRLQREGSVFPYGSWHYKITGNDTGTGNSYAYFAALDVNITVGASTYLEWKSYVAQAPAPEGRISLELKFTDGSYARDLGITDPYGNKLHPALHVNRVGAWEEFSYNISVTQGKTIDWIGVAYDDEEAANTAMGQFTAYFDQIRVVTMNETARAALPSNVANRNFAVLRDGALVVLGPLSPGPAKLYAWSADADPLDANDDGILNGTYWIFVNGSTSGAETSNLTVQYYKGRELRGPVNPLFNDSDYDGILDGLDGLRSGSTNGWWEDLDGDGNVSAADRDADGDAIADAVEDRDRDGLFEPAANETNAYVADSDGDGRADGNDTLPLDFDNDGLTGWPGTTLREGVLGTNVSDWDTDDDGLADGAEDRNGDGVFDAVNDTSPLDSDSDDDGLWDGYNIFGGGGQTLRVEAENYTTASGNATIVDDASASGGHKLQIAPTAAATYNMSVVQRGLYQLNLTLGDAFNESAAPSKNPKNFTIEFLANSSVGFRGVLWPAAYNLSGVPLGNLTNLSLRWFVRFPASAAYTLRIACDASAACEFAFYIDAVNLSRIKYAGEASFGTNATGKDTDRDHLLDGTEWGITWDETVNDSAASSIYEGLQGTTYTFVPDGDNATVTDALRTDSDGDGLWDGWQDMRGLTGSPDDDRGEDYDANGRLDNTGNPQRNESLPDRKDTDEDGLTDYEEYVKTNGTDPGNPDTDGDGLRDGTEVGVTQCSGLANCTADLDTGTITDPRKNDTDGDSLRDGYDEDTNFNGRVDAGESNPSDPGDTDNDLLTDSLEVSYGAVVGLRDTDNDGIWDGIEVRRGLLPGDSDTDNDGAADGAEDAAGTNASVEDTDGDGIPDGKELLWNVDSDGDRSVNAADIDSDDDGLWDGTEEVNANAAFDPTVDRSNMTNPDTDGDGETDLWEFQTYGYDPNYMKDADDDRLTGFSYLGVWYGGTEAVYKTDFNLSDTDGDGLSDWDEVNAYQTNATKNDTDGDGLFDGVEVHGWTFWFSNGASRNVSSNPLLNDTDLDGLNDSAEYGNETYGGSDPNSTDTDGDYLCDAYNATTGCVADPDSSEFDGQAPRIENISLGVTSKVEYFQGLADWLGVNTYWLRVSFSVRDPSKICGILVTLVDLAPQPDPAFDEGDGSGEAELDAAALNLSTDETVPSAEANASDFAVLVPFTDSCNFGRFKYTEVGGVSDFNRPWNKVVFPVGNASRGGNFSVTFALTDRGTLTDGYRVVIQAQDFNGNMNTAEQEGKLDKSFAQKAWDKITSFVDIVGALFRAFLSWMIEAAGEIIGLVIAVLLAIAQSILDIIVGLPSMIYQLTTNFNQMVGAFGSILSNPGSMLEAIIQGSIDTVDSFTPTSWKQQWAPCTPSDTLNLTVAFFQNPFVSHTDSRRLQLCAAFVVGTGIGMILGMVLTGGITMLSVLGKAGKLSVLGKFGQKVAGAAGAAQEAVKAAGGAVRASVKAVGATASAGVIRLARGLASGLDDLGEGAVKSLQGFAKKFQRLILSKERIRGLDPNFDGARATLNVEKIAAKVGKDFDSIPQKLRRPGAISSHHFDDSAQAAAKVKQKMDGYGDWSGWDVTKKKGVFGADATELKLKSEGHTVYRKSPNAGGTDFNDRGIDMLSKGPDGKWYVHEVKTTTSGDVFDRTLTHKLNTKTVDELDAKWIEADLDGWVSQGKITASQKREILTGLESGGTVRSVTIVADVPTLPGPRTLGSRSAQVEQINVVVFDKNIAKTLGL